MVRSVAMECGQICDYVGMWSDLWLCRDAVRGSVFMLGCGRICGYIGMWSNLCLCCVLASLSVICNLLQSVDFMTMLRPCSSERS